MKRKKVVRIIARLNIGGPAIHTVLLTKLLSQERFESILVTGALAPGEGDMSYFACKNRVRPVFLSALSRDISIAKDIVSLLRIYKLLIREKPDIVHTHTAKAGALGRIAAILYNLTSYILKRPKCVIVHTYHGHVFHSYFSPIKTALFLIIERTLGIFSDAIIVISDTQGKDIVSGFRIAQRKKVHTIPLGFDLSPYLNCERNGRGLKKELAIPQDTISIGIVGRLTPIKNHKLFIKVAERVISERDDIIFLIIGDGELKGMLESTVNSTGLSGKILFLGWRRDLAYVYDSLDIVALTSFNEGTPVSLIEAMASKKPVISTSAGGVQDIFYFNNDRSDGNIINSKKDILVAENGILVKSNDHSSFLKGLNLMIEEKKIREEMGQKGRKYVKNRFGISRLVSDIEELYINVLTR